MDTLTKEEAFLAIAKELKPFRSKYIYRDVIDWNDNTGRLIKFQTSEYEDQEVEVTLNVFYALEKYEVSAYRLMVIGKRESERSHDMTQFYITVKLLLPSIC